MSKLYQILLFLLVILLTSCASVSGKNKTIRPHGEGAILDVEFSASEAWDQFEKTVRESYAYFDHVGEKNANAQFARSRELASTATTKEELRRIMHQTALTFTDPHFIVGPFDDTDYNLVMTSADILVKYRKDKFYVGDVRGLSAASIAKVPVASQIISIDGIDINSASVAPFGEVLDTPSVSQREYGATLAVNGRRGSVERTVVVERQDGLRSTIRLPSPRVYARSLLDEPPVMVNFIDSHNNIGVIRFNNSLGNNATIAAFDESIHQMSEVDALVIDLRNTPSGGNTDVARSIIGHFVTEPRPYQIHTIPAVERALGVPRRFVEYVMPRKPFFKKPVFVLHGAWTGSMGEGLVIGMDAATSATVIGADMSDLLGALWNFKLDKSAALVDFGGEKLFHALNGQAREDFTASIVVEPADTSPSGADPAIAEVIKRVHKLKK